MPPNASCLAMKRGSRRHADPSVASRHECSSFPSSVANITTFCPGHVFVFINLWIARHLIASCPASPHLERPATLGVSPSPGANRCLDSCGPADNFSRSPRWRLPLFANGKLETSVRLKRTSSHGRIVAVNDMVAVQENENGRSSGSTTFKKGGSNRLHHMPSIRCTGLMIDKPDYIAPS